MILHGLSQLEMEALREVGINRLKSETVQDGLASGTYYFYLSSVGRIFWSKYLNLVIGDNKFYLGSWQY